MDEEVARFAANSHRFPGVEISPAISQLPAKTGLALDRLYRPHQSARPGTLQENGEEANYRGN